MLHWENQSCKLSNLRLRGSSIPPCIFSLFSIFHHFSSSTYWNRRRFFFPRGYRQPLSKSLDSDRRPFAFRSDHVGEKEGQSAACFSFEAAARASSPIQGTFLANRSENFAVSDVCNWQIILMVILGETCHRQPHEFPWLMRDIWCYHIDINLTH